MLTQCCVCKRIEDDGAWLPADEVLYDASHTYCPECAVSAREEIRAFRQACPSRPHRRTAAHALHELFNPPFYSRLDTGRTR